jgi:hypothetical protein
VDNEGVVDNPGAQEAAAAVFVVPEEEDAELVPESDFGFDSDFASGFDSDLVSPFAGVDVVLADLPDSRESVR